jgi:prevent-host-death family protein
MMTMKEATGSSVPSPRRVGVAEAKSKLSEVLRDAANGPTIIHSRGRDLAVLLAIEQYEHLVATQAGGPGSGGAFLRRIEAVKGRHGGGVDDFQPAPMAFRSADPFAQRRAPRE